MLARDAHVEATPVTQTAFPSYVVEQQRRLAEKESDTRREQVRAMTAATDRVPQHCAALRECADILEASVLALGVGTTHHLISSLNDVRAGLESMKASWSALQSRNGDLARQREATASTVAASYAALLEKNHRTEKELKQLVAERDRKDAALDKAVEYVHCVVAERAAWQQKNGFNAAELPVEEQAFSAHCGTALSSLYAARDCLKATAAPSSTSVNNPSSVVNGDKDYSRPSQCCDPGARYASVSSARNTHLAAASNSARHPQVSSVDDQRTLAARWQSIEAARRTTFVPHTRLRYIPPTEEVAMLRDVLSMGVGSSVLMRDLEEQRAAFAHVQQRALTEWHEGKRALQALKRELAALKTHVRGLLDQGIPFIYYRHELVRLLNEQVEREVQRRLQHTARSHQRARSTLSHRGTLPDLGHSHLSEFSQGPAEDDDETAFSTHLPHFSQRAESSADVHPFVFPPRRSDVQDALPSTFEDGVRPHTDPHGTASPTF